MMVKQTTRIFLLQFFLAAGILPAALAQNAGKATLPEKSGRLRKVPSHNEAAQLRGWPAGSDPVAIGSLLATHFVATPHTNFGAPTPPSSITYSEVCAWYGALRFAGATKNKALQQQLEQRFRPLLYVDNKLVPRPDHVDHTVFGVLPLALYQQTHNDIYLDMGKWFADAQWRMPANTKPEYAALLDSGYSWQTRMWIDDMFMITAIQVQAYNATGNTLYVERTAKEIVKYLDALQQPNGLFYHAPDVPFFWCRGNGWVAAGITELLRVLPATSSYRPAILQAYTKMMHTLKQQQDSNGMWHQLVDDPQSWAETSGSAMFAYAMITGVKKGWLNAAEYAPVARKAWLALMPYINSNGDVREVCEGTNKKNDRQYYLDRKRITGDMHGQAPYLWCATALAE
jgi:unsaturated rhamnogalacturonyl hydrolase